MPYAFLNYPKSLRVPEPVLDWLYAICPERFYRRLNWHRGASYLSISFEIKQKKRNTEIN
jgi:hypothetical protein